jgi:hypothetical protein
MSTDEYKKELRIDPNRLDEELIEQPALYMKYAELSAHAKLIMDRAKEALDLCRAVTDKKIRETTSPDKKLTVDAINAMIIDDPAYKEANKTLMEAGLDYNILVGAREAFNHKRSSLDNITKLIVAGFWAEIKCRASETYTGAATKEKVEEDLQDSERKPSRSRRLVE